MTHCYIISIGLLVCSLAPNERTENEENKNVIDKNDTYFVDGRLSHTNYYVHTYLWCFFFKSFFLLRFQRLLWNYYTINAHSLSTSMVPPLKSFLAHQTWFDLVKNAVFFSMLFDWFALNWLSMLSFSLQIKTMRKAMQWRLVVYDDALWPKRPLCFFFRNIFIRANEKKKK